MSTTKLILNFDVNETIMLGDPASGDTFEDSLNKIIAKSACLRVKDSAASDVMQRYEWHDGTPLDPSQRSPDMGVPELITSWARPPGVISFYEVDELKVKFAKVFTEDSSPGRIYRPLLNELDGKLRVPPSQTELDPDLTHSGGAHQFLFPAFLRALTHLASHGRDFALVFRTYGKDGPKAVAAMRAWSAGLHPLFPAPAMPVAIASAWRGRFATDGSYTATRIPLELPPDAAPPPLPPGFPPLGAALAEREFADLLAQASPASGMLVLDDYHWWAGHGWRPAAGKPHWVTRPAAPPPPPPPAAGGPEGAEGAAAAAAVHPIFFDDNLHNRPDDSIVQVRVRAAAGEDFAAAAEGPEPAHLRLQGVALVRVPTADVVRDEEWFVKQIQACDEAFPRIAQIV